MSDPDARLDAALTMARRRHATSNEV